MGDEENRPQQTDANPGTPSPEPQAPIEAAQPGAPSTEATAPQESPEVTQAAEAAKSKWREGIREAKNRAEEDGAFIAVIGDDPDREIIVFTQRIQTKDGKEIMVGVSPDGPFMLDLSREDPRRLPDIDKMFRNIADNRDGFYKQNSAPTNGGFGIGWTTYRTPIQDGSLELGARIPNQMGSTLMTGRLLHDDESDLLELAMQKSIETAPPSKKHIEAQRIAAYEASATRADAFASKLNSIPLRTPTQSPSQPQA